MKSYIVYTRNSEEVVNAEGWNLDNNNNVFFRNRETIVAVFNLNVIDGFKETELETLEE